MSEARRIGVFFCMEGAGAPIDFDLEGVAAYARELEGVRYVEVLGFDPAIDPEALAWKLKREDVRVVVVAGDEPGHFKGAFTRALALSGGDPERVRLASFREHGAIGGSVTERAKAVVACAVFGVPFGRAAVPEPVSVHPDTLVIGGGVAGIQASLEIADAGKQVILVERTGTIGGHMAMFDKTFPTLDCAACILTPKMVAVAQHPMIDLMTWSEVVGVSGSSGSFRVRILRKARYVDPATCVACHACMEVCPVSVPSEFDHGITTRKAIYMPFPQAVPNSYLIDRNACTFLQSEGKKCGVCLRKCAKGSIHFDEQDEVVEVEVGNIVVATGYDVFDARRIERYGYGVLPNVLTALEFERLTNASGPTGGSIVLKTKKFNKRKKVEEWVCDADGVMPKSVAIIHCVGSRDARYNRYCSRVCCMYSLKFAHLVREKLPDAACYEFYIDMRAFGKGYEDFFERIKHEQVFIVRGPVRAGPRARRRDGRQGGGHPERPADGVPGGHGRPVGGPGGRVRRGGPGRAGRDPARRRRMVQRDGLQHRPHEHRAGRGPSGRRLPGAEGHPRHRGAGLGDRREGAEGDPERKGTGKPGEPHPGGDRVARAGPRGPLTEESWPSGRIRGWSRTSSSTGPRTFTSAITAETAAPRAPSRASRSCSPASRCGTCRWAWRRSCRGTSSHGSATTAASAPSSARARPSPARR